MNEQLTNEQRRSFILKAGSLLGVSVCAGSMAAFLNSCEKDENKIVTATGTVTVNVASETGLQTVGDGVKKTYDGYNANKPVIIVKTGVDTFMVFSAVCNHQQCIVSAPKATGSNIVCSFADNKCGHEAEFSPVTGVQTVGPNGGAASGGLTVIPSSYNASTKILTITF
ncbi:MAG: hypothetical protein JNJ85_10235 [Candidatus Kapabacteria bacterium]|nr:hypothetical protein [Candidatus Kapabacteria bacterium]